MFGKKLIFILILSIFLVGISAVSASEDSQNSTIVDDVHEVKSVSLSAQKVSTTYCSGKYFKVKAHDTTNKKQVSNLKLTLKVFTGNKYKTISKNTDSKGIVNYDVSKLSVGKHKIKVNVKDSKITAKTITSTVKVKKAKLTISAPKITNKFKTNKKFKIIIKNKESKKAMKGIKVLIKVFSGKKFKMYLIKSNKNGVVSISTKSLKVGSHKVTVKVKESSKIKSAFSKSTIKTVENANYLKIKVKGKTLNVKLENNKAAKALIDKLKKGNIKISAKEYGNFEKVGDLGFSLPANDKYITTSPGDLVLYDGDEISLFYNSNSWEYTKLGKVQNTNNLKKILGKGDVTLILTLK